jgi:hypothetical protein
MAMPPCRAPWKNGAIPTLMGREWRQRLALQLLFPLQFPLLDSAILKPLAMIR